MGVSDTLRPPCLRACSKASNGSPVAVPAHYLVNKTGVRRHGRAHAGFCLQQHAGCGFFAGSLLELRLRWYTTRQALACPVIDEEKHITRPRWTLRRPCLSATSLGPTTGTAVPHRPSRASCSGAANIYGPESGDAAFGLHSGRVRWFGLCQSLNEELDRHMAQNRDGCTVGCVNVQVHGIQFGGWNQAAWD